MDNKKGSDNKGSLVDSATIEGAINNACRTNFGVLDTGFLCRSISVLEPRKPLCVPLDSEISFVLSELQRHKIGCVLVVDGEGKLRGIFSERDLIKKVIADYPNNAKLKVSEFMSPDPITQPPDGTIAFALNLMSNGGFRHLPIVDPEGLPIGVISVKDVMDFIVTSFTNDLLNFDVSLP